MKKVININFQGSVVPIEESAYDILRQYIDSLRTYFSEEEGKDEIINDIESRISELFQERLKGGATCITDDDVNAIIDNMGRPKDFAAADSEGGDSEHNDSKRGSSSSQYQWQPNQGRLFRDEHNKILGGVCSGIGNYLRIDPWIVRILFIISGIGILAYLILWIFIPSNTGSSTGSIRKLYRNPDDKVIAGVCGGIGSYFNISSWIPRILFLIPLLSVVFNLDGRWLFYPNFATITFLPGSLLIYIVLWAVIPVAKTTSEKLEMKGEKIDLDSIKESVSREMKEVAERLEKMGRNAGDYVKEKGPQMRQEFSSAVSGSGSVLGNIIITIFKIFVYIILGSIAFALLATVFALAVAAIGVFPLKNYLVADGWQNILAWGTLIFFVMVPVVGITTFIIRQLARRKSNRYFRNTMIGLWILGWICLFALISFVGRDFKFVSAAPDSKIELVNPATSYLEVKPLKTPELRWRRWMSFAPYTQFRGFMDDTVYAGNVIIRVFKSSDNQYAASYTAISNGHTQEKASVLASKIRFHTSSDDSVLYLDNAIPINTTDKFRNQLVEVRIYVPLNHRIKINNSFRSSYYKANFTMFGSRDYWNSTDGYYLWPGHEYIMTEDGPKRINSDDDDDDDDDNYRYKGSSIQLDSMRLEQRKQIDAMERTIDSVKEAHKRINKNLQDSLMKKRNEIDRELQNLDRQSAASLLLPSGWGALSQGCFIYI